MERHPSLLFLSTDPSSTSTLLFLHLSLIQTNMPSSSYLLFIQDTLAAALCMTDHDYCLIVTRHMRSCKYERTAQGSRDHTARNQLLFRRWEIDMSQQQGCHQASRTILGAQSHATPTCPRIREPAISVKNDIQKRHTGTASTLLKSKRALSSRTLGVSVA